MFTGIITHIGIVNEIQKSGDWRFTIAVPGFTQDLAVGASIACNGACLTAIARDEYGFSVQVSQETLARTTLGQWQEGERINLERALKAGDELGGHFVSGHVDGLAKLVKRENIGESLRLDLSVPTELNRYIAEKGSVTLDGVSLTVNETTDTGFSVNIIPHTQSATILGGRKEGDSLNLEIDIIARYLARLDKFR
ncbi:MAG TPA: riboflavin synthase [Rickettsiales bacterium]|nr:riboflavin synthase [Rickettsiales bacterium]